MYASTKQRNKNNRNPKDMKQIIISIAIMLVCIELIAQTTITRRSITIKSKVEKPKEIKLDQKNIKLGFVFLFAPKLKNHVLRASLSFKPDKKTFEMLDGVKFRYLTINYNVQPEAKGEKDNIYSSSLNISKEAIVDTRKMYATEDLFSFSDYDWEWEDVPFGTTSKKIRINITKVAINGKECNEIHDFYNGLNLEFKFKDSKSRFEDLSGELLNRGIYPNKEAFEILFESNPKVFYENPNNLSSEDLSSLIFPQVEGIGEANQSFKKYNFKENEIQKLKKELDVIIESVKLKKVFNKDSKQKKKQLEEISIFLSQVLSSTLSISENEGNLMIAETRFIIRKISESNQLKTKIINGELENFNSAIEDVTFLIKLLKLTTASTGALENKQESKKIARLVSYKYVSPNMYNKDVSVRVIVNTSDNKPFKDHLANGYSIKCTPWARRNEDVETLKSENIYYEFNDLSTPTEYPNLPVASYSFWIEDESQNKISLSYEEKNKYHEEVNIRPTNYKITNWLLRLLSKDEPLVLSLGIIN